MSTVIVGSSVAGVRTVQALRAAGHRDPLVLVGEEVHRPYDRPPLSKQGLDEGGGPVPLLTEAELGPDLDLRLGVRATGLEPRRRRVLTTAGEVPYTRLVIATGAVARTLPGAMPAGVHTLRTLDDAVALREALRSVPRVVVVGAGFIGAEFASAARSRGCPVDIVETQAVPMAGLLGEEIGGALAALHARHSATLHTGASVDRIVAGPSGRVAGVALDDGRLLDADLVVVGIGARPATDWLEGSGLPVADGVDCDAELRVKGFPDIFAVGDVARRPHPLYDTPLRIEHWTNAGEHAMAVAAALTGGPTPRPQPPYVWSDQYGHRIQIVGRPGAGRLAARSGHADEQLVGLYSDRDGRFVGAVVVDDPRTFVKIRKAVVAGAPVDTVDVAGAAATTAG